jgi:uncharacterized protein YndB with AHSA1/START domain
MSAEMKNELTIVRVLDASRRKVWRACREPEALEQWWGLPDGATMPTCNVDFRVGGALHFECAFRGTTMWFTCVYREIAEGEKLVLEQHKSDPSGRELDSSDWPASIITLRFEDLHGKTKLTVTHTGMASSLNAVDDFKEGWSQSLNRLADSVTSTQAGMD